MPTPPRRDIAVLRAKLAAKHPKAQAALAAAAGDIPVELLQQGLLCAVGAGDQDAAMTLARRMLPNVPPLGPLRLALRATLADYCRERGLPCATVVEPVRVEIAPSSRYTMPFAYTTEPAVFASVPRAQFIPGWDFVIGEDDTVLYDTGYLPPDVATHDFMTFHVGYLDCLIHYAPAEEVYVDEEVLFLSAPRANVGHWMIDFLPRLKGMERVPGGRVKVVVPQGMPARYLEMLEIFGFGAADLVACDPAKRYRFRMCHVYRPGLATPPNPVHVRFVREGFTRGRTLEIARGKKVFLTRNRIRTRLVENSGEFEAFLKRENIASAELADLSVADQHKLLNDVEVILGTFGSDLFGMYFAPAGCTVLALMNDLSEDVTVAPTAHMLGQRHQIFLCDRAREPGLKRHKRDTNVVIDCAALGDRLREIAGP